MVIKISKKFIDRWLAPDFIKYFGSRFYNNYTRVYPVNHAKEGMIVKRLVSKFRKNGKSKESVIRFIDWVFEEYMKRPEFEAKGPLTIGFLPYWSDEFLNLQPRNKKAKRPEPELTVEIKEWLEKKKKEYRPSYVKRGR